MGYKSYNLGRKFEEELANYFASKDYYVIYNEKGVTGSQPCDLIIIKGDIAIMVECKNLDNKSRYI